MPLRGTPYCFWEARRITDTFIQSKFGSASERHPYLITTGDYVACSEGLPSKDTPENANRPWRFGYGLSKDHEPLAIESLPLLGAGSRSYDLNHVGQPAGIVGTTRALDKNIRIGPCTRVAEVFILTIQ